MVQNGRIENFVRSHGPRGLNQILVGTDCRHVLRTFNGMSLSHENTYTDPLQMIKLIIFPKKMLFIGPKIVTSVLIMYCTTIVHKLNPEKVKNVRLRPPLVYLHASLCIYYV